MLIQKRRDVLFCIGSRAGCNLFQKRTPATTVSRGDATARGTNSSKIAGTIPYIEIAAPQCLAPLVDLAEKARKIETKNDY
jgi:hypothetical protein